MSGMCFAELEDRRERRYLSRPIRTRNRRADNRTFTAEARQHADKMSVTAEGHAIGTKIQAEEEACEALRSAAPWHMNQYIRGSKNLYNAAD